MFDPTRWNCHRAHLIAPREPERMANPNLPPDPPTSLSAAELRRRLLASTPPPLAAASTPALDPGSPEQLLAEELPVDAALPPPLTTTNQNELLARLRMPGRSGAIPVPAARPVPIASPVPTPTRPPINRRTPLSTSRIDPNSAIAGALNQLAGYSDPTDSSFDEGSQSEIQRLRVENKELRNLLQEMKHLLQEASDTEQQLVAKEKEFEAALAAKDAQIHELSLQLGAIEEQIAKGELVPPPPPPKTRSELEEWSDELEKESAKLQQERKRLEEDRRQLREDEEALEKQMRDMEVAMARERALLARQETELRRLNAEIQHELELMQRGDSSLREQMAKFHRRAQEVLSGPSSGPTGRR